jgi:uncharacterized protein with PIN domain
MTNKLKDCPKCHKELVHVHHADFVSGKLDVDPPVFSMLNSILPHSDLSICPGCGLTLLKTKPELKALAVEIADEKGGHS